MNLDIFIITYNRSFKLNNTLGYLSDSPFKNEFITVLDNCSTDETQQVCSGFEQLSNFKYLKNKVNIGGDANIIRAVELSDKLYTWVICDDDEYDFSYCDDVIECIINEKADLIHVGAHDIVPWDINGIYANVDDLMLKGYKYFAFGSFLPCNIFKTQLFYDLIIDAYNNIPNMYPHMPMLLKFYEQNRIMYVAKNRIVIAILGGQNYNQAKQTMGWLRTCQLIQKQRIKEKAFFMQFFNKSYANSFLIFSYVTFRDKQPKKNILELISTLSFFTILKIIVTIPFVLIKIFFKKTLVKTDRLLLAN